MPLWLSLIHIFTAPLDRNGGGINPKDLEIAVRSIVTDYVSYIKSEGMMLKGLEKLLELKEHFFGKLTAHNPHELMRCLEVKNIFDMIEMHIRASLYRKETRKMCIRDRYYAYLRRFQCLENQVFD